MHKFFFLNKNTPTHHSDVLHYCYHNSTLQTIRQLMTNHTYMFTSHEEPEPNQDQNQLRQVRVQFSPDEEEHSLVSPHLTHVPLLSFSARHCVHQAVYFSFSLPSSPCSGYAHHLWSSFCFSFSFCLVRWLQGLLSSQSKFLLDMLQFNKKNGKMYLPKRVPKPTR